MKLLKFLPRRLPGITASARALTQRNPPIPQLLPSRQRRSPVMSALRPASLLLAAVALLALFGALALPAQAQSVTTLVSNTGQSPSAPTASIGAQPFTTGSAAVLTSVGFFLVNNVSLDVGDIRVRILEDNSGSPGTALVTLSNPTALEDNGINTFTAPSGTNLAASTTYYVEVSKPDGSNGVPFNRTRSPSEDAGGATGWEIGNTRYFKNFKTDPWGTSTDLMLIAIKGTAAGGGTPSSDATLSALTVTASGTDLVTFASDTETYTAMVANDVAEVTVTATKNDSGASIDYLDGSDMTLDDTDTGVDGHQVTLAEGDNVIKVKVTAADTSTKTYMVTVTRAAPDTTAPTLTRARASTNGSFVDLYFSEDLDLPDGVSLLATIQGAFSLTVDGVEQEISKIVRGFGAAGANRLLVYPSSTIYSGQTVVVSYDQSAASTDAIADPAGNEVADFTTGDAGVPAVVNNSTQTPSSDATLSGLTVTAGGTDLVTFVSDTETYAAMVANAVAEVTVTATKNDSGASIDYLDGDDMTLDDADTGVDGHQVTLAEGDNVIKVKVTAADTTTKTYTVTVTQAAPDLPNNATTTGQVDVGGSVTSNIDRPGDGDWFGVALEADKRYQIDVEGMPTGRGTLPDTRIFSLYDADDTDLSVGDADGGVGNNARLIYTPTASGTYYVAVTGTGGTGTYTLSVIYLGANGASEADTDFPDDTTTTGKVDVGGSVTGNIDATDDFDRFGVDLEAGRTYQIDLEGMLTGDGTLEDPALDLFDPDNTFVDGNDDINFGAGNLNSRLTYTAPTTGTYFLRSLASVGGTGTYTLSVRDVTTLSGLTVTGGGSDLVTFVGTTDYTAMVANDVAEVTVTPMAIDSGATIEYLDGDDATINDAGTADGHQVALDLGENVIKVKVTATDGTTQTFTVTVTRAAADPQTVTTFVSNTGEMPDGTSSSRQAQSFRTGSNTGGYMLSKVAVSYISGGLTSGILVKVKGDNGSDEPGDLVADLDNPSSLVGNSINSFTAPASTETLAADTVYWVVVNDGRDSDRLFLGRTSSSDETATPADPNWSIGDKRLWRGNDTDPWSSSPKPMMIAIDGAAVGGGTPSSDATLSGLTVTAGGTDLVTFASDTETYTAMVANAVAEVTVTATKNDSGASIEYLDGDDATLDDADTGVDGHQVTLAEGDNVIKVKVTAADSSTKTYTVTVSRAASTCTLNTGDLWCGVVTVGTSSDGVGFVAAETETDTDVGALTDNDGDQTITIGSDSYTIPSLLVLSGARAGTLAITLDKSFPTDDVNTLEFDVGSKTFKVSEATAYPTGHGYFWADSDLTWSDGGPNVTLRLRRAPTTCTLNTGDGDIWCGVVTVEAINSPLLGGGTLGYGFDPITSAGALSDTEFSLGSNNYTIDEASVDTGTNAGQLNFSLTSALTDDDRARLFLHIDDRSDPFAFSDADLAGTSSTYDWPSTGLDWSSEDYVTLRLRATPSTDATLSDLLVYDGTATRVTLTPTFMSGIETYTASVANDVADVTVTPMTSDTGATIEYLDGDDATLDDANISDDPHQVAVTLALGDNVIKVKVTAQDTTTTKTYTVTVTRAAVTTFVSNTGEILGTEVRSIGAQPFTAGSAAVLTSVDIRLSTGSLEGPPRVRILEDDAGSPGAELVTLSNPSSIVEGAVNNFTAPAGTMLTANTTYYVELTREHLKDDDTFSYEHGIRYTTTGSDAQTGATDWEIGNSRYDKPNIEAITWSTSSNVMMIAIKGDTPSTDATLSGLVVNDGTTDLTLTPTFASDTETYTASVAVTEVTVTPTTDSGATIEYLDGSDMTLDDANTGVDGHQVTLAEGDNVIKVKVTAADSSTKTYTVTVTQAAAASTCTLNTGDLWCGVVTVGTSSNGVGFVAAETDTDTDVGALTDNNGDQTITVGSDSYTIPSLLVLSGARAGTLAITLDKKFPTSDVATLEFDIGSKTFKVSEATAYPTGHGYFWADSDLTWSDGGPNVTLRLRRAATFSMDATLSALTVTAGGTDLVTFASDTETYTASVANDDAEVTVTAETTDSGATVAYLDGDDATITDADTGVDGQQVTLAEGDNVINVKVTAEDGNTTKTYTVTVTRAAASTCTLNTGDLWCGVVTVETYQTERFATLIGHGFENDDTTDTGALSDTEFSVGTNPYTIDAVYVGAAPQAGELNFGLTSDLDAADLAKLVLHVDGNSASFAFSDADYAPFRNVYYWDNTGLDWSSEDYATLRLREAAANVAPSFTSAATFGVDENGTTVGTVEASDDDTDDEVTGYELSGGADQALFSINDSGVLTFQAAPNYEAPQDAGTDNAYEVTAQATSGTGDRVQTAIQSITVTVTNADEGQTGTVSIDDTSPMVEDELTASTADVADPDGLPDPFAPTWQWYRTPASGSETELSGATSATYTVVEADLGAALTAKPSWTDSGGFANTLESTPTNAVTAKESATLPELSVAGASATEGSAVTFTVTLSAAATTDVTATWTASIETGDSAEAEDFESTTGTATVSANQTTGTFEVPTANDTLDEDDDTFTLTLSSPSANATLATDPTATGTITDNDEPPTISVEDQTAIEGDLDPDSLGDTGIPLQVTLSAASEKRVRYKARRVAVAGDTATDEDFHGDTQEGFIASFTRGETVDYYPLYHVKDDALDEPGETFTVEIYDFENATAGAKTRSTITIEDDDDPPSVSVGDATADEGSAVEFTVTLTAASGKTVTATWTASTTEGDEAKAAAADLGSTTTGTVTVTEGQTSAMITVATNEDTLNENDETFTLTLSSPTNATLATDPTATGTITDDDDLPSLSIADSSAAEGSAMEFTVTLTPASGRTVTVGWGVDTSGTASDADLSGDTVGTVSIPQEETSVQFEVTLVADGTTEGDETFVVNLGSATNANISDNSATGTISDSEMAVTTPTITDVAVTSTPMLESDTYGEGETIEVTVTFSEAVNATTDTDFVLSVGGAKRAPLLRGSGTVTMVFGYTVLDTDSDTNGIWIGDQDRTLVGNRNGDPQNGTITSEATGTAADLTHSQLGQQNGHKVDGSQTPVQPCTLNTGDIWCGVVTVANRNDAIYGFFPAALTLPAAGDLSDKTFDGYTIEGVWTGTGANAGKLFFDLTSALNSADKARLVLHVGSDSFAFSAATGPSTFIYYNWESTGLDWSSETHVTLRLRETNRAPEFPSATATREVPENSAVGTNVGDAVTADDAADGDTLTYTLEGADAASFDIVSTSGQIRTKAGVTYDYETTSSYSVTVKADDGNGGTDTITVTITVTDEDEQPDKPAKPTVTATSGSTTSLDVSWTEPGLNGGPEITGYEVLYQSRASATDPWSSAVDWPHTGTTTTTAITGLMADTEHRVQVRALNGETPSAWSDDSEPVRTNADTDPPTPPTVEPGELEDRIQAINCALEALDGESDERCAGIESMPGSNRDLVALQLEVIGQLPPGKYDYYDLAGWQWLFKMESGRVVITKAGAAGPAPLTARLTGIPEAHDGETAFSFRVAFSEDIGIDEQSLRDHSFTVSGGEVTGAQRDRHDLWEITVAPDSDGDVTITLPGDRECGTAGAVCTLGDDPSPLTNSPSATVAGPADDARDPNTAATGTPTISGTPQVGETLTADTSGIADENGLENGLENVSFSYLWLADDTANQGATNSTYTLIEADEGKAITVQVSFTDDAGNDETLTSAATDAVAAKPNSPATGAPTISGTAQVGETLTADTSGIADADGISNAEFAYQWQADDTDISGATGSTYTLADADEGKTVKVQVSFTDEAGNDETLTSGATEAVAGNEESMTSEDAADWSAIMTVEWVHQGYGYYSTDTKKAGALSPASFNVDGTAYTVKMVETQGWWMYIGVDRELPFDFVLELDGERFASDDASFNSYSYANIYRWEGTGLSLSDGDAVEVRLLRAFEDETAVNSAATGAPTISGTAQVGETLTADSSGISDADGLDNAVFGYQWLADGTDITAAKGSTHPLADADEGKAIKVKVSFTDDAGNEETLTSAATDAVAAKPNSPVTGAPTISGTAQVGETLTADTSGIADADGLEKVTLSYQWLADDTATQGATGSTYTILEADGGKAIKVRVSFTDDAGNDETLTSAATDAVSVAPQPNSPATGAPTISGTVQVGKTLTADTSGIADADGLENVTFSYQWLAGDDAIAGATGSTYTLADADEGKTVKVRVSFTDDGGNDETLTSAATEGVAGNKESLTSKDVAVWSAVMTVEWIYQGHGYYSTDTKKAGALSPASFNVDGTTYTVKMVETKGWWMYIGVDRDLPFGFVLELDGERFASDDASFNSYSYANIYRWEGTGLSLSDGDAVEVRLLRAFEDETAVNSAATGAPIVSGTVQVGETLTADTSGISDEDGMDNAVFSYQWLADDTEIQGATNADYTLADADEGKAIRVQVSFTDDAGNPESLTSASTDAVEAAPAPNNPATGAPSISGTAQVGEMLTADTSGIADEDGLDNAVFNYQWLADAIDISGATGSTYTPAATDEGKTIKVQVSFTDDAGNDETLTSAAISLEWIVPVVQETSDRERDPEKDFNTLAAGNVRPAGIWSDGTTMWVTESSNKKIYAYNLSTKAWDSDKDFNTLDAAGNVRPAGIWSDGTTMWVADSSDETIYAYNLSTKARDSAKDFNTLLAAGNGFPEGIWSDGTTMWVADSSDEKLYAYNLSTKAWDPDKDFNTLLDAARNESPKGIWSDGTTMWVTDNNDDKIHAYNLSTKAGDPDKDFNTLDAAGNEGPAGIWSDGTTMWVADYFDDKIYAYDGPGTEVASTPNSPPTGLPTIIGAAEVGETLTVDTSGINDADGLTGAVFSYQWVANDGNSDAEITDATDSTYILVVADEGKTIKVRVSFTDDDGNGEALTSEATAAVEARSNTPATGTPTISGTPQVGQTLSAGTSGIADADGLTNVSYSYQWLSSRDTVISGATSAIYVLQASDATKTIKVRVTFTDDAGNDELVTSAATEAVAAKPNSPATGEPTIGGTVRVGDKLTADTSGIADADGLSNATFTYQWLAGDTEVAGATGSTYTLADTDEGKAIKVRVSFTDDGGNDETLTSVATAAVTAPEPPARPTGLTAEVSHDSVTLTWDDPNDDSITGYVILRRDKDIHEEGTFETVESDTGSAGTTYTDDTVEPEKQYVYRIKAINANGVSEISSWVRADTPAAPTPEPPAAPTGLAAEVSHNTVTLTWDDPQDDTITGYVILRRNRETDAEGEFTELAPDTGTAAATYTDDTVAAETPYTYRIKAINEHGTSERSRWVHVETTAAPTPEGTPEQSVSEGDTDLPNDNSTPGRVAVGGSATGAIGTPGDQDRFAVELEAGRTYRFDLTGSPGGGGTLPDTFFRAIYNSEGQYQPDSYNDDFEGGRDSRVTFTPTESGTYYARVSGDRDEVGSYTLSVQ